MVSIARQLRRLVIVAIVLLAAYVSVGRQFMPAIAEYTEFVETQLLELTGLPVSIKTLTGTFSEFNPSVEIEGLSLLVTEPVMSSVAEAGGLLFDRASLTLDVPASVWQRRWVFEEFDVAGVSLSLHQNEEGAWQLRGLAGTSPQRIDVAELYSALLGVSYLRLSDVVLTLEPNDGEQISIGVVDARIQNRKDEHVLQIDLRVPGTDQLLQVSYEGQGAQLESASAFAYANIPTGEYLPLLETLLSANLVSGLEDVNALDAGGEIWLQLADGDLVEATATLNLDSLQLRRPSEEGRQVTELSDFRGVATVRKSKVNPLAGGTRPLFEFVMQATRGNWDGKVWEPFSAGLVLRQNDELELRADSIDLGRMLGLVSQLAEVGFLPVSEGALAALDTLSPRGRLRNLSVKLHGQSRAGGPIEALTGPIQTLSLKANTEAVGVEALAGIPMLDGVTGYLELVYGDDTKSARGFAEVDTSALSMNLPNVFTRDWDYNYVNGRIDFISRLGSGLDLKLLSNTIFAESATAKGRVKFATKLRAAPGLDPQANLELLVGVERMNASERHNYLPDGPRVPENLKATMNWVGGAVQAGELSSSGAIFRGSTLPGAHPLAKTFQSFYEIEDGAIVYADGWPAIEEATAFVTTADNLVDVSISTGSSLGLELSGATATVRPTIDENGLPKNRLLVEGEASGLTQDAINFLSNSPLPTGFTETISTWQASGEVQSDISVDILFGTDDAVDVRAELQLEDNSLSLPEYDIAVDALSGGIVFDTQSGLESENLTGDFLGHAATFSLASESSSTGAMSQISVSAQGKALPEELARLELTSALIDGMLGQAEGELAFDARLVVEQEGNAEYPTTLQIESDLVGVQLDAPTPLAKKASEELELDLMLGFNSTGQWYRGSLDERLEFDMRFDDSGLDRGIVFIGESPTQLEAIKPTESTGLVVLGGLDLIEYEEWESFLERLMESANNSAQVDDDKSLSANAMASALNALDIEVGELRLLEQSFANASLRIQPNLEKDAWRIDINGPELEGYIEAPIEGGELLIGLQRLRIRGGAEDQTGPQPQSEEEESPIDSLAELDPRKFPALRFSTRELTIGDREYGSWRFHLIPESEGAAFTELAFDFRGLQLDPEKLSEDAIHQWNSEANSEERGSFFWRFDGQQHTSEFDGVLTVKNISDVLRLNGYAPSLESSSGQFDTVLSWPGTPAFFSAETLSGEAKLEVRDGRFLQGSGGAGALKLISILNFDAVMRRLRFSDDLLRSGLAFDRIEGDLLLESGQVAIQDRLVISGPSSLYQITGDVDLVNETILGEMYVTLPVSNNIPWLGLLTANIPIAVGAYLFDQIFGDQVDSLTSAAYTLDGPWEGLEPKFRQAFGSPQAAGAVNEPVAQ